MRPFSWLVAPLVGHGFGVLVLLATLDLRAQERDSPRSARAPAADDQGPSSYRVDAFVRLRYRQSWVTIAPRLREIVEEELPDRSISEAALRAVRDTARERDGLIPTRADLALRLQASPSLQGELRVDWARLLATEEMSQGVRELSGVWSPLSAVSITAGIFALPFSLHELFEERGFQLTDEGPSHELLEHLRYYGRETGLMITMRPLPQRDVLAIDVAAAEGGALGAQNYRGPGLFVARATARPLGALELTSAISWRPRPLDAWWEELRYRYQAYDQGAAIAMNAALLFKRWTLRAEWMAGRRTDPDVRIPVALRRGEARSFAALWLMATAQVPLGSVVLVPAARAEWLDIDRDHADVGELIHLTCGLNIDINRHLRLSAELSRHLIQPGTRDWNFDVLRYQTDATTGTLQLQLGN